MRKKLAFTLFSVGSLFAAGVFTFACVFTSKNASLFEMKATDTLYSLTLNSQKAPAELTSEYQDNITTTIQTANGNNLNLNIVLGKTATNKYVQLASRGIIYNFGSESGRMNGINGITVTFSGSLLVKTSSKQLNNSGAFLDDGFTLLTSGTKFTPSSSAKYFAIVANDGGATIDSIKLDYTCSATDIGVSSVNGTYTGVGSDGYTWQLDLNNGNATIHTLDRDNSQLSLSGTYELLSDTQAKCTFEYLSYNVYYIVNMSPDGSFTYVSKSDDAGGAVASQVAQINFNKVFDVEDFENYTTAGYGYDQNHTKEAAIGVRAQFFCDYNASGGSTPSPVGGSTWKLMGSSDYMQFTTSGGHNGSNAIAIKGNGSNPCRYMQANALYGVPQAVGKGSTLSFWAKGAYSDNALSTQSGSNATITALAYYVSKVDSTNHETAVTTQSFSITAKSGWKEYKMALDTTKNYYAIGFVASTGSTYTPIDDIKIYTANAYAVPPGIDLDKTSATMKLDQNLILTPIFTPENTENKNVTWSSSNSAIAVVNEMGVVTARSAGSATITCTTVVGGKTATCDVTVEEYDQPYFDGTYVGQTVAKVYSYNIDFHIALSIGGKDGKLALRINNNGDPGSTSLASFNKTTGAFTIATSQAVKLSSYNVNLGTVSGIYNKATRQITNLGFSNSSVASYLGDNNNNITLDLAPFYYGCEDDTVTMQTIFIRRYGTGSPWTTNSPIGASQNWQTKDTTNYLGGDSGMSFRVYTGGKSLLNLRYDLSGQDDYGNIGFWIYNPNSSAMTIRLWTYTAVDFGGADEIGSVTANANGWSYCCMGFNNKPLKLRNFQIMIPEVSNRVVFENISLY